MIRKFPKNKSGYVDLREETSFGERFYVDRGRLSRHLRINRSGKLYRIANDSGFLPSEYPLGPSKENVFSKFLRKIWERQPNESPRVPLMKESSHEVPRALLQIAKENSKDFGLRFTWEKKHVHFRNNLGVDKSKLETTNLVRIDRVANNEGKSLHLRRFLYGPSARILSTTLNELRDLEKSLDGIRPAKSSRSVDVILDPAAASVWLHEVVGHWAEKNRSKERLNEELGKLVAPSFVNIYDTPRQPKSTFKFAFDEEGIESKKVNLIREGKFCEPYLSLERAYALNMVDVNGHARAQDFKFSPTPRMMNICLAPGKAGYEEMIREVKDGYLLCGSLGGLRGNSFSQVQCQYGYRIERGKISFPVFGPLVVNLNSTALENIVAISKEFAFAEEGGCQSEGQFLDQSGRAAPYLWLKNVQIH